MLQRAESAPVARPPHQAGGGGSIPTSALSIRVERTTLVYALELNRLWHSRLPEFGTGCFPPDRCEKSHVCFAGSDGHMVYAVAIWSKPAARRLPQRTWLELRRFAIAPDAPRNTGSRMLRVMALLIRRERPSVRKLISYQDTEAHVGTIYRASGWVPVEQDRKGARHWNMPSRPRPAAEFTADKIRWEKSQEAR